MFSLQKLLGFTYSDRKGDLLGFEGVGICKALTCNVLQTVEHQKVGLDGEQNVAPEVIAEAVQDLADLSLSAARRNNGSGDHCVLDVEIFDVILQKLISRHGVALV